MAPLPFAAPTSLLTCGRGLCQRGLWARALEVFRSEVRTAPILRSKVIRDGILCQRMKSRLGQGLHLEIHSFALQSSYSSWELSGRCRGERRMQEHRSCVPDERRDIWSRLGCDC